MKITLEIEEVKYSVECPDDTTFPDLMDIAVMPLLKGPYSEVTVNNYFTDHN